MIFQHAFSPTAAFGGFAGASIAATLRWGVARGCYSNEAGMGTASIAHAAAVTDHPTRQAMWGMFGIMVDTMIICTTTALVILVTDVWRRLCRQPRPVRCRHWHSNSCSGERSWRRDSDNLSVALCDIDDHRRHLLW